jgi:peptidoglycan/xylan/chitin deacetylase (PgdA/CDA1 family)
MANMPIAEWIITFDDGPLPGDLTTWTAGQEDVLLDPLTRILEILETHPPGPIPAVFYLRGKVYPWGADAPLDAVLQRGVQKIVDAGHSAALHCNSHDPDLWFGWALRAPEIFLDLDAGVQYFTPMLAQPMTAFRPPYGQGGLAGTSWAVLNRFRWRTWDIDSEDWLHHPDVGPLIRRYVDDPHGHLQHILQSLPVRMLWHTFWPGANDFLMHVSVRTASYLDKIIDGICATTRALQHEPRFVVPSDYLRP